MEQEEIWKDIAGYEGIYQVSNLGRVKSVGRVLSHGHKWPEKILKQAKTGPLGYQGVCISKNGTKTTKLVHRLVANAFIPNNNLFADTVNHKDKDKTNNRADNLEWMSVADNVRYSEAGKEGDRWGGRNQKAKPVRCVETGDVFDCASSASRVFGQRMTNSISVAISRGYRCGGYHWEYVEKDKQTKQQ